MKKIRIIFGMIVVFKSALYSQQPVSTIYFDNGKARLNSESKVTLTKLVENIKKSKNPDITISGFTDAKGSTGSNLVLSKKRALAVSDYFTASGIEKKSITIQFFGEDKPVAKNEKDLKHNRRVEIAIITTGKTADQPFYGIFRRRWKVPVKIRFAAIKVTSGDALVMYGPEGTVIRIPPNSLYKANGELATGDVDVELTECYKKSDILLANLHTASDSALLETGGMINVVARSGRERLSLKKGSEIEIEFPVAKNEQDMEVFIGKANGNQINWKRPSTDGKGVKQNAKVKMIDFVDRNPYQGYDSLSAQQMSKIDNLVLSAGQLGWINCDRFTRIENKTNLSVEIDPMYHAVVRLVFKNINSIMPGYKNANGDFNVINIPIGQKATLVAFGMVGDIPYFGLKDILISDQQIEKLVPKKTTFVALSSLIKKVD